MYEIRICMRMERNESAERLKEKEEKLWKTPWNHCGILILKRHQKFYSTQFHFIHSGSHRMRIAPHKYTRQHNVCYFWWKHCKFDAKALMAHGEMERDNNTTAMNCAMDETLATSAVHQYQQCECMHFILSGYFDCVCEWVNELWRVLNV